jgi:hypothetical protein
MVAFLIFLLIVVGVWLAFGRKAAGKTILITILLVFVVFVGLIVWLLNAYPQSNPSIQSTSGSTANQWAAQPNPPVVQPPDQTQSNVLPAENQTNSQQCQASFGLNSIWSGQNNNQGGPICDCANGYTWNSTQTGCIAETDSQICQAQYGPMSIWTGQFNANGGPICGCPSGYTWSTDNTACVTLGTPQEQSCQNSFGPGSDWTGQMNNQGGLVCGCQTGYVWNYNNTACVSNS